MIGQIRIDILEGLHVLGKPEDFAKYYYENGYRRIAVLLRPLILGIYKFRKMEKTFADII